MVSEFHRVESKFYPVLKYFLLNHRKISQKPFVCSKYFVNMHSMGIVLSL